MDILIGSEYNGAGVSSETLGVTRQWLISQWSVEREAGGHISLAWHVGQLPLIPRHEDLSSSSHGIVLAMKYKPSVISRSAEFKKYDGINGESKKNNWV